jgi:hypothetical protein
MQTPPERPKGHRPYYFDDPAIDQLHAAFIALATELSVAFDRIDTLERLIEERGDLSRADIDGYVAEGAVEEARAARRADLAKRLLKPFVDYREALFERSRDR